MNRLALNEPVIEETPYLGPLLTWRCCPVCSHSNFTVIQRLDDVQFYQDGTPRVRLQEVQCHRCYTLYKNPTFSSQGMDVLFKQAAASYGSEHPGARASDQVAWCWKHGLTGNLLDYGCGDGVFVSRWNPFRHRAGVERDPVALAKARDRHVFQSGPFYPPIEFTDRLPIGFSPDVITMWHVLEHIPCPSNRRDALLDFFRGTFLPFHAESFGAPHLKTRRLVVEVPILELGFTDDICGFFSNQHVTHFSRHSLDTLLRAAGWEPYISEEFAYNGRRVVCRSVGPVPGPGPVSTVEPGSPFGHAQMDADLLERIAPPPYVQRDGHGQRGGFWHQHDTMGHQGDVPLAQAYMQHHRKACRAVDARLRRGTEGKPFVIWGAGMHTEMLYQETSLRERMPVLIVDNDPGKVGTSWRGVNIHRTARNPVLSEWNPDAALVISSYGSQREIMAAALAMGVPESAIVTLYDDPVVY